MHGRRRVGRGGADREGRHGSRVQAAEAAPQRRVRVVGRSLRLHFKRRPVDAARKSTSLAADLLGRDLAAVATPVLGIFRDPGAVSTTFEQGLAALLRPLLDLCVVCVTSRTSTSRRPKKTPSRCADGGESEDPAATLDDLREAVTTIEETERIARRVFGGTHPLTVDIEDELRAARAALNAREPPQS